MQRGVPILMYHGFSERVSPAAAPFFITPSEFQAQMSLLKSEGFNSLTVSDLVARRAQGQSIPERAVVITVDDGYADFDEVALPALQENGLTATLYVATGFIGSTTRWLASLGEGDRPMLSWQRLRRIADADIEIGAHTIHHVAVDRLDAEQATAEIEGSKKALEDVVERQIHSFAYPYGLYGRVSLAAVAQSGCSSACAINYRYSDVSDNHLALSRMIVRRGCDIDTFRAIVEGNPPRLQQGIDQVRSRVWRTLRQFTPRFSI